MAYPEKLTEVFTFEGGKLVTYPAYGYKPDSGVFETMETKPSGGFIRWTAQLGYGYYADKTEAIRAEYDDAKALVTELEQELQTVKEALDNARASVDATLEEFTKRVTSCG